MPIYLTVVRDPDSSNEYHTDSDDLVYVDIDLGSCFDGSPNDEEQAAGWAEDKMRALAALPKDTTAYSAALDTILTALESYDQARAYVERIDAGRPQYAYDSADVEAFEA